MLPEMSLSTGQICRLLWIRENEKGKSVEMNFLSTAYHFCAIVPSLYQVVLSQATKVPEVATVETVSIASIGWILSWFGSPLQCSKTWLQHKRHVSMTLLDLGFKERTKGWKLQWCQISGTKFSQMISQSGSFMILSFHLTFATSVDMPLISTVWTEEISDAKCVGNFQRSISILKRS